MLKQCVITLLVDSTMIWNVYVLHFLLQTYQKGADKQSVSHCKLTPLVDRERAVATRGKCRALKCLPYDVTLLTRAEQ